MNDDLAVWLGDEPVGALARTGRRFEFQFTRRAEAVGILTVASEGRDAVWTPGFTRAWFDNLLPEETRRTAAEAQHGVDRGDSFGLLAEIGWECAGAVSVLPNGRRPASGSYQPLDEDVVWERLDALPRTVAGWDREVRLSLGGAQEKLLLARLDGRWHLPLAGAVSVGFRLEDVNRLGVTARPPDSSPLDPAVPLDAAARKAAATCGWL